ncbi:apoptosis-stimulating of p53 protein 2b isoform X3 [Hemibagrus wyckioides]|uniref:apoptosis-stimulating of p53 protein 2b isoform X3 n=1 Tax=Hemibagrus wyckioides TaxID=337641 RepID=UPI00266D9EC6|nr:apoptosis-stimulating of p53 protein 2b isoform X3 [Hemibagrus wyckioides]
MMYRFEQHVSGAPNLPQTCCLRYGYDGSHVGKWSDFFAQHSLMFLTVYLSNSENHYTEVPVTPETLCRDVVDVCKEPGETECYLAESWRGSERVVSDGERMMELLQRWGQQRSEVQFVLRHERAPGHDTGTPRGLELSLKRNMLKTTSETHLENGMVPPPMDISLTELQEMASRQQQQINVQQQVLASKEQRLRFLKMQEQQQREQEKLRLLRENAENQEAKLRRVRALKGQVEQKRLSNSKLVEEIEQMNGVFQQKQRELLMAVSRVEELSKQLETLRSGKLDEITELERLYKELQLRNKLNQEQSAKLHQQKECLSKRTQEVAGMERRLADLRQRLWKKKAALQQKENLPQPGDGQSSHPPSVQSRIAAVGPYIQSPAPPLPPKQDVLVKPAYLDGTSTLPKPLTKPTGKSSKLSEWSVSGEISSVGGSQRGYASTLPRMSSHGSMEKDPEADWKPPPLPLRKNQSNEDLLNDGQVGGKVPPPVPSKPKLTQSSFPKPCFSTGTFPGKAKPTQPTHQLAPHLPKAPMPAATVRPFSVEGSTSKGPTIQKPQTLAASSIYSMYTQQSSLAKGYQGQSTLTRSQPRVYGKPVIPSSRGQHLHSQDSSHNEKGGSVEADQVDQPFSSGPSEGTESERAPRPLSPTKLLPFLMQQHRLQSDAELETPRRRLQHAPRPLKKRSSITEPEGPGGPNIQKLLYQKTTLAAMEMPEINTPAAEDTGGLSGGAQKASDTDRDVEEEDQTPPPLPPRSSAAEQSRRTELKEDDEQEVGSSVPAEEYPPYPPPPYPSTGNQEEEEDCGMTAPEVTGQVTVPPGKRTNLRKVGSERISHSMRVRFNPLALLLDASLEGEYDLVQRIIYEVEDPSMPNDEGITALHNAVCAGHTEIMKFLVQFGVNVNAADSDGWTPLHCAASCNNVQVCKFLVESGAAVFATTYSDMQTAAEKCEELEDGYAQCSQFLYGVQEKMGVMNRGIVYSLWDYEAEHSDELSFTEGDCITVLRHEDRDENEWWWARCGDNEGYIPRNLLGLYLRIKPRQRSLA